MRTSYPCVRCPGDSKAPYGGIYAEVPITTEPVVLASCRAGHQSVVIIEDPAYAMLFERALERLVAGNTRDAVVDAYTAFEMYISHVPVRAAYERDPTLSPMALRKRFEPVIKQAERAQGAAFAVAALVGGVDPPRLNQDQTTALRNKAVHAGHYPTPQEAERMCLEIERVVIALETILGVPTTDGPRYWTTAVREVADAIIIERGWTAVPRVYSSIGTVLGTGRLFFTPPASVMKRLEDLRRGGPSLVW